MPSVKSILITVTTRKKTTVKIRNLKKIPPFSHYMKRRGIHAYYFLGILGYFIDDKANIKIVMIASIKVDSELDN